MAVGVYSMSSPIEGCLKTRFTFARHACPPLRVRQPKLALARFSHPEVECENIHRAWHSRRQFSPPGPGRPSRILVPVTTLLARLAWWGRRDSKSWNGIDMDQTVVDLACHLPQELV